LNVRRDNRSASLTIAQKLQRFARSRPLFALILERSVAELAVTRPMFAMFRDASRRGAHILAAVSSVIALASADVFCAQPAAPPGQTPGAQTQPQSIVMDATPLSHMREGVVRGCGVRLTGGVPATPVSSWFDVSFNVFLRGVGLVQSLAYELRRSEYDGESRPERVPVQSTWLTASEAGGRVGENVERRDTLVYRLLVDDVFALFEAVATGRTMTLGIRRWGEREDRVHSAMASLDANSRQKIASCLGALALD